MSAPATIGVHDVARQATSLAQLEVLVTRKLDGLLAGDHQSASRGAGSEAGDARSYQPGDDARRIDWSLTARTGTTHVRDTTADRELETWLVIDASASLDFGTARSEKRDLALAAAGAFSLMTARAGNRVGAVVFDGAETTLMPPRSGRDSTMALLRSLEQRPRSPEVSASLADAVRRCRMLARRRGVIVVISDLLDDGPWEREIRAAAQRHEITVAEILDPREDELPAVGLLTLVDPETGRRVEVQTDSRRLRERFAAAAKDRRTATRNRVRTCGVDHLQLSTDRDWLLDIVRHTTRRRIR